MTGIRKCQEILRKRNINSKKPSFIKTLEIFDE